MILLNLFRISKKCEHAMILPEVEYAYCPDCGELVYNEWYISRCNCCGVKLKTITKNDSIIPQYRYCSNCGNNNFSIEKIEKINFIDINFAVLIKRVVKDNKYSKIIQCWEEKTDEKPKLLTQCQ